MNNYHRPKMSGSCDFVNALETELKKIPGTMILKEGGKREPLFKDQEDFQSPTFLREYLIPAGYQGLFAL